MNRRLRKVYQIRAWCPKVKGFRTTSLAMTWRRKSAIASLIVLALIASSVGAWKSYEYMEWLNGIRAGEAWLRRNLYPRPRFWWNYDSVSGFALSYKGDEQMLTLLRGETGSIELVISANASWDVEHCPKFNSCELHILGTLDGSGQRAIVPPGVRAEFTPSNVTLPSGGNVSVLHTISVDPDATTGQYVYFAVVRIANYGWIIGDAFWLDIGPYTPHGNFSLVEDMEDFIARDEINVSRKVRAETFGGAYSFDVRSEGPPLNVTLEIVNIDMPEGVKLSVPQQVFVPARSQAWVVVEIGSYASPEVGRTYHFKVICRSGNETHVANFNILVYIP